MDYEKKYKEALKRAQNVTRAGGDVAMYIVQYIFPELAESEDERIRKYLIDELKAAKSVGELKFTVLQPTREECIAYLEKQKEQKPRWEINNPHTTKWTKEMIDEKFEELVEKYHKQKPVEWSETKELVFKDICNHLEVEGYSGWVVLLNALYNGEFQPKPEWSEEDVKRLYSIGTQIGFLKGKYSEYQKDIDWLYALAEKMGFHKCKIGEVITEWKKEDIDDKMLSKPKQEWSEEDEKMIERLITRLNWITYNTRTDGTSPNITFFDEIDWLKSLRPSWKPSEEQMYSLGTVVKGYDECTVGSVGYNLKKLYEHLKKLM